MTLVFLPGRTGDVPPDHALHQNRLGLLDEHGPAGPLVAAPGQDRDAFDDLVRGHGDQVVFELGLEFGQPPCGNLGEDLPFVGNGLRQDHVERAHPVTGHHEEAVGAGVIDIPHLALSEKG